MNNETDPPDAAAGNLEDDWYEADLLAALMDGTRTLDSIDDDELGRMVRVLGQDALLRTIAEAPKLVPVDEPETVPPQVHVAAPRRWSLALAAASAAVLIAVSGSAYLVFVNRDSDGISPSVATGRTNQTPDSRVTRPGNVAMPDLLVAAIPGTMPTDFRGSPAPTTRTPRNEGAIIGVSETDVQLDLGSIDGLENGMSLDVRRVTAGASVGVVTVTRVFLDRSTAQTKTAGLGSGDRVQVPSGPHITALLEVAIARAAAGDLDGARELANRAVGELRGPGVTLQDERRAYTMLGQLERRTNRFDDAEEHLRTAVERASHAPAAPARERAAIVNELGVLLIARGNSTEAERLFREALASASAGERVRITNNLAAVAALRGDVSGATTLYQRALAEASPAGIPEDEMRTIARNLEKLRTP